MTLEVSVDALQLLRDGWNLQLWAAHEGTGYFAYFSRKYYVNANSQRAKIHAATGRADSPGDAISSAAQKIIELYP